MSRQILESEETRNLVSGEVIDHTERVFSASKLPEEPNYIKLYINAWCAFKNIKGVNNSFLFSSLQYMTFANRGQIINFNPFIKQYIAKELGWSSKSALDRCNHEIRKLTKAKIFKSLGGGTYQVNPQLVGKGPWKDILKLQATFELVGENAGNVSLQAEYEEEDY